MTFNGIVLKNLRQNFKNFGMYLFSLLISIILYFSFVTLKYTKDINNADSIAIIKNGSSVGTYFLFVIIVIFLMYANQLFIKKRLKEIALYQLIGLTKRNIIQMIMVEQAVIFLVTGVLGMIIGILSSKLLLMIVLKMMGLKLSVTLTFSFMAVLHTAILIAVAYILIIVQSMRFFGGKSIRMLMSEGEKTEVNHASITRGDVIVGILGVVMITAGYYLSTILFKHINNLLMPFLILFLTVLGAYFFFRGTVSLMFKSLKRSKRGFVHIEDVIFTSSIMHRMKKNAFSLTVIAIISAITVTVLCFAAISNASNRATVDLISPSDITLSNKKIEQEIENKFDEAQIAYTTNYKTVVRSEILDYKGIKKQDEKIGIAVTSDRFFSDIDIKEGEAGISNPEIRSIIDNLPRSGEMVLGNKKQNFTVNVTKVFDDLRFSQEAAFGGPVVVLDDAQYRTVERWSQKVGDEPYTQYGINITHKKDMNAAAKIIKNVDEHLELKRDILKEMQSFTSVLLFVTSFLGIAFLIAAGCIIYIKQMDETEDEMDNYRILRKLGFTHMDMAKGLKLKVTFNFALPLIIGLLHAYFAAKAYMMLMGVSNTAPVYVVMVIYTLIYTIFAFIAYRHSMRTIKHTI